MSKKRFNEIIIHIGLHKTGTTTIQSSFFKNSHSIELNEGILYPRINRNHGIILYSIFCGCPEQYHVNIRKGITDYQSAERMNTQYLLRLENELSSTAADKVLFSGEDISLIDLHGLYKFKEWLNNYSENIRIIAWLREPISWAQSALGTKVKEGKSIINNISDLPLPRYKKIIEKFIEVFGASSLELVDYDKATAHPEGIIGRFCEHLNITKNTQCYIAEVSYLNKSVSHETLLLISKINEKYPLIIDGKLSEDRYHEDVKYYLRVPGKKFSLDKGSEIIIQQSTRDDVLWLYEQFGFSFCSKLKTQNFSEQELLFSDQAIESIALNMFSLIKLMNENRELLVIRNQEIEKKTQEIEKKNQEIVGMNQKLEIILNSKWWKITSPLRYLFNWFRSFRKTLFRFL